METFYRNFVQVVRSVKNITRISLCCHMDLSKLIHGFPKVAIWICQSCYMDLLRLLQVAKQIQAEVDRDFKAC